MSFPFEIEENEDNLEYDEQQIPAEYEIDFTTGQLTGNIVTGVEALKVWIWLALHTTRYRHVIFSWDYGSELDGLIGKSYSTEYLNNAVPELIRDCLLVNENILDIENVEITIIDDKLVGSFTAITTYGEVEVNV